MIVLQHCKCPRFTVKLAARLIFGLIGVASFQHGHAGESISLFDGQSLQGWEGDPTYWRVEEGAIVGEIPRAQTLQKNTWLVWRGGELDDFDLNVKFKLSGAAAANSGIQFRCQVESVEHVSGYQADLDQGATWLGRIYDEHGRALLVERGSRVRIDSDGSRQVETFAPANQYAVLFREGDWNEYRIVAVGEHVAVYINGTLFSEMIDRQQEQRDLTGLLALQLHSGPETRVEFRELSLERLDADDNRVGELRIAEPKQNVEQPELASPAEQDAAELNLGFERGNLEGWTATGDAFNGQPVNRDGIAARWPGQTSNKQGDHFIGGFEVVQDRATGTLTSKPFTVTYPYASFLIGGGSSPATCVELILAGSDDEPGDMIHRTVGDQREQMRREVVDLRPWQGKSLMIRLVDTSSGAWGHLNFDDFRFHDRPPLIENASAVWRSTQNPLLQHLVPNQIEPIDSGASTTSPANTLEQMFVPRGFSVDLIAAEPDLHQPMAFTFDAKGRLWVAEGYSYPQKRAEGEGLDRILIFTDRDGDGSFEHRYVFAEGLNLVSGMEVGHGGVWIGAAPELLFLPDRDGDDVPDGPPETLLDGFGYADTHETLNSFLWGPDGWLYGNQGVFNSSRIGKPGAADAERVALSAGVWRYHPTRHLFEVFAHGGSNQWGLDYDQDGQLFMTHCRSYWGKGPTTHVMQGGHYWNQVNGGHAPFISPVAPTNQPALQNFLLASARYGHGEGGAGKRGSREVYGGHSHVGTMIYLGDNWPDQYRNHLFTHNLHGHQMNHQVNRRVAGGYRTYHAGYDMLFCADPQYIGVDLKVGPDGAVYVSDWYDPRHCHNPNVEQWDRGNGRMYRIKYDATYRPVMADYTTVSDDELVDAQLHKNDWHARMARLVMYERAEAGLLSQASGDRLKSMVMQDSPVNRRLRALWSLHVTGQLDRSTIQALLADDNEYLRAWTIQLAAESMPAHELSAALSQISQHDSSPLVLRYLASAIPRLPTNLGWSIASELAGRKILESDRELTLLTWYAIGDLANHDVGRALVLAEQTRVPLLRDFILWYAAKLSPQGRDVLAAELFSAPAHERLHFLELLELAVRSQRGLIAPKNWLEQAPQLYDSPEASIRLAAESLGSAFGDRALFDRMRIVLADQDAEVPLRRHALTILEKDNADENQTLLLALLDHPSLCGPAIPMLMNFDDPAIADALIARLPDWSDEVAKTAMEVLVSRPLWASRLLDAVESQSLSRNRLTAYDARQIHDLGDMTLRERLTKQWGSLSQSSQARRQEIDEMIERYRSAPLWAYSEREGAGHFKKLCAACHQEEAERKNLAPKLAGSGSKGIEYLAENILDPNAVIGRDFQARNVLTSEGLVITGLVEAETDSAITIRTPTQSVTIATTDIDQIRVSENSFMPEGLLTPLNDREQLELLKYLMSL